MKRHFLLLLCVPFLVTTLVACATSMEFKGITKLPVIDTSSLTITEVQADGSTKPFQIRATPDNFLLLYFGYTSCPDICPTTLADIRTALSQLSSNQAERVSIAFVTVDREIDTPQLLTSYLNGFDFGERAHALRPASDEELVAVTKTVFASSEIDPAKPASTRAAHTAWTYVIDDRGRVVVEFEYGTSSKDMANDLKLLLNGKKPKDPIG